MELPIRGGDDVYLPDGSLRHRIDALRRCGRPHELTIGMVYAFDYRTRMLPFWYTDKRMAPAAVRVLGDVLHASGFDRMRIVLQQWSPNVRPSLMRIDGRPLDILLVSAKQVHAEPAYDLIRDAHNLGEARPLIVAGGPKAIYEPTDFLEIGPTPGIGADCVVTGEAYVLLELLDSLLIGGNRDVPIRRAFEMARDEERLRHIPGLVYLSPESTPDRPVAINTGVQRLLRDLDELPLPDAGYRLLEPPHRGKTLKSKPASAKRVGKLTPITSVVATQGCRFNCPFCPIPAINQKTWRHKSPERFAAEIKHIYENFGIASFFGTDDNFFNKRQTVETMMGALARTETGGEPLGKKIKYYTEATQADVFKNKDLLPLCRKAGLHGLWFGIEDLTGDLVKKGQSAARTNELFTLMHSIGIQPHAMMIHSDTQPLRSGPSSLAGLLNQARYIFDQGAFSYQCTYLGPAVGTRDLEPALQLQTVFDRVGGERVPNAYQDGNHVAASGHPRPWRQQINLLRAYATFYNPFNVARILLGGRRFRGKLDRLLYQLAGHIGLILTAPKMLSWAWRLRKGPIEPFTGLVPARIPMVDAETGEEIQWAIRPVPARDLPVPLEGCCEELAVAQAV